MAVTTHAGSSQKIVLQEVVAASGITYDVPLEPGSYQLALLVDSNVTGTTTTLTARPITNPAPVQVGKNNFQLMEPDDAVAILSLVLTAADEGRFAHIIQVPAGVPQLGGIPLSDGLQVTVAKGTAVAGEKCRVTLIACKVA